MRSLISLLFLLVNLSCVSVHNSKIVQANEVIRFTIATSGPSELSRETVTVYSNGFSRLQVDREEYTEYLSEPNRCKLLAEVRDPGFIDMLLKETKDHYEPPHFHISLFPTTGKRSFIIYPEETAPGLLTRITLLEDIFEDTYGYRYQRSRKFTGV